MFHSVRVVLRRRQDLGQFRFQRWSPTASTNFNALRLLSGDGKGDEEEDEDKKKPPEKGKPAVAAAQPVRNFKYVRPPNYAENFKRRQEMWERRRKETEIEVKKAEILRQKELIETMKAHAIAAKVEAETAIVEAIEKARANALLKAQKALEKPQQLSVPPPPPEEELLEPEPEKTVETQVTQAAVPAHLLEMTEEQFSKETLEALRRKRKMMQATEREGYIMKSLKRNEEVSLDRNFITPIRAMNDYLLTNQELIGLRKSMRRSPHGDHGPMMVYWLKDVVAKAKEVWGTLNELQSEKSKRDTESQEYRDAVHSMKRILKKYREYSRYETAVPKEPENTSIVQNLIHGSGRIVLLAVFINGTNFTVKMVAWLYTGSHSLFAESIHSLADTINQIILAFGIHKSTQRANVEHPYGYANMKHVASLISGVGIFCVGAGLSFYHGIVGLIEMDHIVSLNWAFYILGGSLLSEGATLSLAIRNINKKAKGTGVTFWEYVLRSQDPSLNVVILEDLAAVAGVAVAAVCMGLTNYLETPIPDAVGSLIIGGLLASVASFIIYSNSAALVGRSIPVEDLNKINSTLEGDIMVRAIHDVKGIDMGNTMVRYKAEVDFDGRELTRSYIEKLSMEQLLKEVKAMDTPEEFEKFLFRHGENIVDTLGAEIDRIEMRLKRDHPEIRHCDLEIL